MERLTYKLTNFILNMGVIKKAEYEMYRYGFQTALEMQSCIIIGILISVKMEMFLEFWVFLGIFILLRSYVGGLHFDKFVTCLIFSAFVLITTLMIVKKYQFPDNTAIIIVICLSMIIKFFKPINNKNRVVEKDEEIIFRRRVNNILFLIILLGLILYFFQQDYYLSLIATTLIIVFISMIAGKWKEKFYIQKK